MLIDYSSLLSPIVHHQHILQVRAQNLHKGLMRKMGRVDITPLLAVEGDDKAVGEAFVEAFRTVVGAPLKSRITSICEGSAANASSILWISSVVDESVKLNRTTWRSCPVSVVPMSSPGSQPFSINEASSRMKMEYFI